MTTAPIQGLRVSLKLADVQNPVEVLRNLNLDINDLDKIRNISFAGGGNVSQTDIQSLSGLTIDLEKQAIAIYNETLSYQNILSTLNDGRRRIAGNLNASSSVISSSFKFNRINYDDNNAIVPVDLSTSRASAWSAFGSATDSVFYGGDVILSGPSSTIEFSSLEFLETPQQTRFESQVPTHKIRVSIDGEAYDLYAMKGIPLQFKGFFRSVRDMRFDFNILGAIRPSWVIRNTDGQEFVYENRISGSGTNRQSTVSFFDSQSREREIEFYYPVDRITRIDLNNTRLFEIPNVSLPNLTVFNAVNGDLIEMPDIATLYPNISFLNLSRNDLTRSDDVNLRTFSPQVISRLKTSNNTLRTLILDGVYSNDCTADLGELTGLLNFRANSAATNSRRMTGTSPAVGAGILVYDIRSNNFTSLHPTVVQSTTLQGLDIRSNSISGTIDTSGTNLQNIREIITGGNSHSIIDVSGKQQLVRYTSDSQSFSGNRTGTTVFTNCPLLEDIRINNTNVTGNLAKFGSNTALKLFASWSTQWNDASDDFSIDEDTFGPPSGGCRPTLEYFNLQSGNLRKPIHPNAFLNMPSLRTLVIRSYSRGIDGLYPDSLNQCFNLRTLYLDQNFLEGPLPNFSSNGQLITVVLSRNKFSGDVPSISLSNLRTFFVQDNELTGFQGLNCPRLVQFNASSNLLSVIPDFSGAFRLQTIFLNNNAGMSYRPGAVEFLTSIRRLEMANCGFNRGSIDRIIVDLNENYNRNPRRNVLVNLVGNAAPSATEEITTIIDRLRREGWTLGLET
jgi:hypothetical protein